MNEQKKRKTWNGLLAVVSEAIDVGMYTVFSPTFKAAIQYIEKRVLQIDIKCTSK